jgi:Protein of unknown function (DUF2778)
MTPALAAAHRLFHRHFFHDVHITLPLVLRFSILAARNQNEENMSKESLALHACAWTYAQKTGELQQDGTHVATGYSGAGTGKNNPAMQAAPNVGPIPQGDWTIVGPPVNTPDHGPCVLRLEPSGETNTFHRSGFLMHGDSIESPGCASHGCIILPRPVREQVWNSGDRELHVVAEVANEVQLANQKPDGDSPKA